MPVPLALMGLNEGVNVFIGDDGKPLNPIYIPAYVRRYPYMLARIDATKDELTLCFDSESGLVTEDGDRPLFDGDQPSETLTQVLKFCEEFEIAAQRTQAFVKELQALDILIDGEVAIQPEGATQPFLYRGFQMVDEQKLKDLDAETVHKLNQNGILPLIMAHLFSSASCVSCSPSRSSRARRPNSPPRSRLPATPELGRAQSGRPTP